ncbi:MAG: hypothetical protein AAB355_02930 [Patescibacteria group bacterium]
MTENPRNTIKISIWLAFALFILFYAIDKTKNLLEGPVIAVNTPENGIAVEESVVLVSGTTRNISRMTINGHLTPVDEKGSFQEQLVVGKGYNIINVVGSDRFGKTRGKTIELIRKDNTVTILHD